MSDINKDTNDDKAEDSLEYLKELMDKKKFKADDKQRRFGRNDDRGKIWLSFIINFTSAKNLLWSYF